MTYYPPTPQPLKLRTLQSRTNVFWFRFISRLKPRQTVEVYRQGNSLSVTGTDAELVGVYDVSCEVDRLWADVEFHATEAVREAA